MFAPNNFIKLIEEKSEEANGCFLRLIKYRTFIQSLNSKYKLTDYDAITNELKDNEEKMLKKELRFRR